MEYKRKQRALSDATKQKISAKLKGRKKNASTPKSGHFRYTFGRYYDFPFTAWKNIGNNLLILASSYYDK